MLSAKQRHQSHSVCRCRYLDASTLATLQACYPQVRTPELPQEQGRWASENSAMLLMLEQSWALPLSMNIVKLTSKQQPAELASDIRFERWKHSVIGIADMKTAVSVEWSAVMTGLRFIWNAEESLRDGKVENSDAEDMPEDLTVMRLTSNVTIWQEVHMWKENCRGQSLFFKT